MSATSRLLMFPICTTHNVMSKVHAHSYVPLYPQDALIHELYVASVAARVIDTGV